MKIAFAGQDFVLHHSGLLFWPGQNLAVVADLHLEKGSHFASRGYFVPPYDTRETLSRLTGVLAQLGAEKLLVLGDTFHDSKGFARLLPDDRRLFDALAAYAPIWVRGNHDGAFVPPGFAGCDAHEVCGVVFRHETQGEGAGFEISGHYHPKADITHKGARLSRRAFISDETRMILPAFGSYAGGLAVSDPAIGRFFPQGYRLHVLGTAKVFALDPDALPPREMRK